MKPAKKSISSAKLPSLTEKIVPQKPEIHENLIEIFGRKFKTDHAKGLAEWIKNSVDAYSTNLSVPDDQQYVVLRFMIRQPKKDSEFECIDFVGTTHKQIQTNLMVWGNPDAAKHGKAEAITYGGHGNGGKYYMRQMFAKARFITYLNGLLCIFGFDNGKYGFQKGYETGKKMTLDEALKKAEITDLEIPATVLARWKKAPSKAGFTVVRGLEPGNFKGRSTVENILDRLRLHAQARRILQHKQVIIVNHGEKWGERLTPPVVGPKPGFEKEIEIPLPDFFLDSAGEKMPTFDKTHPRGRLILRTSNDMLAQSDMAALNSIDILGKVGCLASYKMHELGGFLKHASEADFIFGECDLPILNGSDSVDNDREKLVENDFTRAFRAWISEQVDALAAKMSTKAQSEKRDIDLKKTSLFNAILNNWKNKIMDRITTELFGGKNQGSAFGGSGGGGTDKLPHGNEDKDKGEKEGKDTKDKDDKDSGDKEDGKDGGSGSTPKRGAGFPRVLLSDQDPDPFIEGAKVHCDERHPPIYQRAIDFDNGVYWINTSRKLWLQYVRQYGAHSTRCREYLFQRYVEIILKQQAMKLLADNPEMIRPADIDKIINDVTSLVHDQAAAELSDFLFKDELIGSIADKQPTSAEPSEGAASEIY